MSPLVLYLAKLLVYSGIFAAYYRLFMRKATFIRWNRWYIMFAMLLSVLLPLAEITVVTYYEAVPVADNVLDEVLPFVIDDTTSHATAISYLLLVLYALVAFMLISVGIKSLLRISRLKRSNVYRSFDIIRLYCCKQRIAPFSFFKDVFIPDTIPVDTSEGQRILQHELEHARARHSVDKVLAQLLCTVFWFNPFFWFFRKEQSMVHEFLADRACVKNGGAEELSRLILCSLYPTQRAYFDNHFFQSPIKRRLVMIAKNRTRHSGWRKLLILPLALACFCMFAIHVESKPLPVPNAQPMSIDEPDPVPQPPQGAASEDVMQYANVEVKPLFQGSDAGNFSRWVASRVMYPEEAMDKGIQGRVILSFTIGTDGALSDIKILRSADPLLDNEAKRVVGLSPKWTPAQHRGKKVPVIYVFPVNFTLVSDDKPEAKTELTEMRGSDGSYMYEEVQVKPLFQGADANAFSGWVSSRIMYPKEAMDKGIQGKVILSFRISKDGSLEDVRVVKGSDPLLDNEAKRVVLLSPKWTPGEHDGKKVHVRYTFPVTYTLAADDKAEK